MWTLEARQAARERINQTKPWLYPKTPEGKKRSAMNATKHGMRSAKWRELEKQLAEINRQERKARELID